MAHFSETQLECDGWTDNRPTDAGQTDPPSYTDARMHLKTQPHAQKYTQYFVVMVVNVLVDVILVAVVVAADVVVIVAKSFVYTVVVVYI